MGRRPITPSYIIFYILFLPDSWRIAAGLAAAVFLTPYVARPEMGTGGQAMMFVMLVAIGYAAFGIPARFITAKLKQWIVGDRYR